MVVSARAALHRSVLAQISDPVLVIADNASPGAQIRPLLPGTGPHKVAGHLPSGTPDLPVCAQLGQGRRRRRDDHRHVHTSFGPILAIVPGDIF